MGEPLISVVVRSFNEQAHIERLLIGIFEQSHRNIEVILVDSGSTDQTLAIARKYPVRIQTIQPRDFSFGGSLNLGCRLAQGDFIVLASAHVYPVYRDWLEKLTAPFTDPRTALVYGRQRGNEATPYSEQQVFAKWFPNTSNFRQEHPFCNNANAAVRRSVWLSLPYDETLTGLEDLDWAKRVFKQAYRIAYSAAALVIHVHHQTPREILNRYRREAVAMKRIFPEESFSLWDFLRLFTSNAASDSWHAAMERCLFRNLASIMIFRFMHFCGTYLGYAQRGPISQRLRHTFYYPLGLFEENRTDGGDDAQHLIEYPVQPLREHPHEAIIRYPRYLPADSPGASRVAGE